MKATITLLSFLAVLQLCSCSQKTIRSSEKDYRFSFDSSMAKWTIDRSGAVKDRLRFYIPPASTGRADCDSLCDRHVQSLLERWRIDKRSGDNAYSIVYDRLTRQLEINLELAESLKESKERESSKGTVEIRENRVEIPVEYIPLWVKVLAWTGALAIVVVILRIFL